MNNNQTARRTVILIIVCIIYLLLTIFYHHIDKYFTGIIFIVLTLLIPTTFITMLIYSVKGLIEIFLNRSNLTFKFCLPTVIALTTLAYTTLSPWRLDSENLESKVQFRACYEGTQNQAYIKFRQDNSFELNWTGVFGYDKWWTGKWKKDGDSLFLKYDHKKNSALGDTILIANGYLNSIGHSADTLKLKRPMFYLGYCKHEN